LAVRNWELGTKLIDEKREEEKVNVYEIQFKSIYRETHSKEITLSLLFFILMPIKPIKQCFYNVFITL
jgi:hypothetical protein